MVSSSDLEMILGKFIKLVIVIVVQLSIVHCKTIGLLVSLKQLLVFAFEL